MKYIMFLLAFFLIDLPHAAAKIHSNYLKERLIDLQKGSRTGDLTKREFTVLRRELRSYKNTLRNFKANKKLSKRERRNLKKLESLIDRQFYVALNNREKAWGTKRKISKKRKARAQRGSFNNGPICRPNSRRSASVFQ